MVDLIAGSASIWLYSIVSVIIVSLVSLIGILTIAIGMKRLQKILLFFVSFSAGGLIGGALLHLIPEASQENGFGLSIAIWIILGMLSFFVMEKYIHWRHCHIPTSKAHPHPFAYMNLIGDIFHNFLDGVVIAGTYMASVPLGITTTIAVLLHEIPQEIGDFGVLIYAGFSRGKALAYNFLVALFAVAGAIVSLIIGSVVENYIAFIIPFTAGGFLYIAGTDLIPQMHEECRPQWSVMQFLALVFGIAVMLAFVLLE